MSKTRTKSRPYAAKADHSQHLWALFLRRTPKATPRLIYVCDGGALQMLVAQNELAKHHKVPPSKIEVVAYKPYSKAGAA